MSGFAPGDSIWQSDGGRQGTGVYSVGDDPYDPFAGEGNRLPSARAQQAGRPAVGQWPADGAGLSGSRQGFAKGRRLGAAIQGVLAGVLNIGSYYSAAAAWLPKILRRFQAQYPKVEVHLLEGTNQELAQWLNEKAVDCCLAAKPGADVAYDWIPLKDDELVVWLPPDHPWTAEKEIPVEWLNGAPFIIPLPDHDTDIDRFLAANQVQPDVRFTTTDPYTAYCMVEEGLGISVNNRLTTEKWAGRVELRPLAPAQSISLGIAVPDIQEMSPAAGKFVAQVWQAVNGSPEK